VRLPYRATNVNRQETQVPSLVVVALLLAVGYVPACGVWPFTAYRRCHVLSDVQDDDGVVV
jgi:hypothetical protein